MKIYNSRSFCTGELFDVNLLRIRDFNRLKTTAVCCILQASTLKPNKKIT